ncbi:outer membrane protein [Tritonibacter mobilis]|uniref:outer membrane protein n=1 Tax=Tritonibacter mobilis TaxID=379347 RepID=UPI000806CAE6|nr:outer membrane beta-barrel protein [Tritonibacter mobilis]GLP85603.1 outer membrane protein [Tritonibacter mobilis]SDW65742.1 Opacity protein [Tritonibacter mobilis]
MKRIILASTLSISASAAVAGNLEEPVVEPMPTPPAPVVTAAPDTDWTGFYGGLQYGQGEADLSLGGASASEDFDAFGVHGGYNHDFGRYVLGGELMYNDISGDNGGDGDLTSLRARAGMDLGRFMPYVTAGVSHLSLASGGADISENGFTYGVGAEYLVSERFSVGLEYTKSDFSDAGGVAGADLDTDKVQLRASYRF